jgi:hypothetical protein
MSKKNSYSPRAAAKAALGTRGFVPHIPELLASDAWKRRSIAAMRVLDRLEVEHLAHAGKENGFLTVTHRQFVEYGVYEHSVKSGIEENERRGLLIITNQGSYAGGARDNPSRYQLTYVLWKIIPAVGPPQYLAPNHEWKRFKADPEEKRPRRDKRSSQEITDRLRKKG